MKKMFTKVKNFFGLDTEFEEQYEEQIEQPVKSQSKQQPQQIEQSITSKREPKRPQRQVEQPQPVAQEETDNSKKFRFPLITDQEGAQKVEHSKTVPHEPKPVKKSTVFMDPRESDTLNLPKYLSNEPTVYDVEVSGIRDLLEKRNRSHGKTNVVRLQRDTLPTKKARNVTREETVFLTNNPTRQDVPEKIENPAFVNPIQNKKRFTPTNVPSPVHGFHQPKPIKELMKDSVDGRLNIPVVFKAEEVVPTDYQSLHNEEPTISEDESKKEQHEEVNMVAESAEAIVEPEFINVLVENELPKSKVLVETTTSPVAEQVAPSSTVVTTGDAVKNLEEVQLRNLTIENSTVHIGKILMEPAQAPAAEKIIVQERVVVQPRAQATEVENVPVHEQNISEEIMKQEQATKSDGSKMPFNVLMLSSDKKKLKGNPFQPIKTGVPSTFVDRVELRREVQEVTGQEQFPEDDEVETRVVTSEVNKIENNHDEVLATVTELPTQPLAKSEPITIVNEQEEQLSADASQTVLVDEQLQSVKFDGADEVAADTISVADLASEDFALETLMSVGRKSEAGVKALGDQTSLAQSQTAVAVLEKEELLEQSALEVPSVETSTPILTVESTESVVEQPETITSSLVVEAVESNESLVEVAKPEEEIAPVIVESVSPPKEVKPYQKPSLEILVPPEEKKEDWAWMDEQAEYLIEALSSHQINAQIESIVQGPAVTQFEITVAAGTKVSKVRNLSDDIKLALAAKDIRIDAPIPGKRTIGIEIPNRISRAVRLSEVTDSDVFQDSESPLEAALGLDLNGKPVTIDLRKMPHGLIAGATGSGKSVCINSILVSLLYKADPHELKLMLIDPKMVELAPFNKIPHLVSPVITDVKAATAALKWAVEEMERRYELFMHAGVRDITRFNSQADKAGQHAQKMPYILIVIDELADLMMMSPADVEEAICRIAQKARACGIHLIVATQRPSVDVITGLIKSNIPTRIAFAVSSAIDSRTILDSTGAERLLGRGDMLYLGNGMPAPIRLQGTFVTDDEIEEIIDYVRSQGEPNYFFAHEELLKKAEFVEEQDELFEDVCRYVFDQGTASTSSIQRRYHIGYNRAARLVDMLEGHGFVSEQRGSKPREVFITEADLENLFS